MLYLSIDQSVINYEWLALKTEDKACVEEII
jgi:hypothetical protein